MRISQLILVIALLSGCAATPPVSRELYQLAALPAGETVQTCFSSVGIGPIKWPEYLDRSNVLVRLDANTLKSLEGARWAESLDANFSRVLAENIATSLSGARVITYPWKSYERPEITLEINVIRFDGDVQGNATLQARWRLVKREGKELVTEKLGSWQSRSQATAHGTSVAAQSETLSAMTRDVIQPLRCQSVK